MYKHFVTSVRFQGGVYDGKDIDNYPAHLVGSSISVRHELMYVKLEDCVGIVRHNAPKLPRNWTCLVQDVYVHDDGKDQKGVVYVFSHEETIGRCECLTKKNEQCLNQAIVGQVY